MTQDDRHRAAGPWPAPLDARTAAPAYHAVLLENDQVRVLDTRIGAGETTPVHTHAWPAVFYVLSWSEFVRHDEEGNVLLDSRTVDQKPPVGAAVWSAPMGPHSVTNVGDRDLHVIAVELKNGI
jgi:hypothetical protein